MKYNPDVPTMEIACAPKIINLESTSVTIYQFRLFNRHDTYLFTEFEHSFWNSSTIDSRATDNERLEMIYLVERWNTYGY